MGHTIDFKAVFDTSPNAYLLVAPDLTILEVNQACLRTIATQKDQTVGHNVLDIFTGEASSAENEFVRVLRAAYDRVFLTGSSELIPLLKCTVQRPSPQNPISYERYWKFTHTPILDQQGKTIFVATHIVDVTMIQPKLAGTTEAAPTLAQQKSATKAGVPDIAETELNANESDSTSFPAMKALRILFVEDNEDLRESTSQVLERLGHSVVAVGDAEKALNRLEMETFDVLFSDLSLPKMTGAELAREVVEHYPGTRIIITSGYGRAMANARSLNAVMLPKPYRISDIVKALS
jgi:CheY-like chemotaxis protein